MIVSLSKSCQGEVALYNYTDVKSYTSLHTLVNDMFPPTSIAEQVCILINNYKDP